MTNNEEPVEQLQFFDYVGDNGELLAKVGFLNNDAWMTQTDMAALFGVSRSNIAEHIQNIYDEGELDEAPTIRHNLTERMEGSRRILRNINSYNLDMILSVGYRINSVVGTRFRKWATKHLGELVNKGYTLDRAKLESGKGSLDALINEIRAIRSSERNLADKVKDIFATSIDYDKNSQTANEFFATVNNKLHFAVHGHTSAELIVERINSEHESLGLQVYRGTHITKAEASVAKNYMSPGELKMLHLLVDGFLAFAEFQVADEREMRMKDWKDELDRFLEFHRRKLLQGNGKVSRDEAERKVHSEYHKFNHRTLKGQAPPGKVPHANGKMFTNIIPYGND